MSAADRVAETISAWLALHTNVPGMIVLVHGGDREVSAAAGFADGERTEPMTVAHAFRIASNTKTFVAAATMRLVELGALTLDTTIDCLLAADLRSLLARRYDLAAITVRMLLQHTSGIASHDTSSNDGTSPFLSAVQADPAHEWTAMEEIVFSLERFPPTHDPGTAMSYTDTGYVVLGQLLEHVTSVSLSAVVREHCRLPDLGLTNTWWERFEPPPSPPPRRARAQIGDDDWESVDCSIDLYGGGGLVSNVANLTTWWRALFRGEILRPNTLAAMLAPLAPSDESHGDAGLGLFRRVVAERTWWTHSGYWGSVVLHDPTADITLTAFRNQAEVRTSALEATYNDILEIVGAG